MRVVVAMSGGVDSSVAAALLARNGEDVVGVSMQLYDQRAGAAGHGFGSCCTIDDLHDARRVAAALGVPHYIMNFERQFAETVLADFVGEYARGRTPLPCAHCNSDLKFSALLERARGLGAGHLATGHYARVVYDEDRRKYGLARGRDREKDQSYFLFSLTQEQLARARFPVGALAKREVREIALSLGLHIASKPDSQELCFVPNGDYASIVERHAPGAVVPGVVADPEGRVLARHGGIHRFTVGQRKGLGISAGQPLYVLEVRPDTHTVVVGGREALERVELTASRVNWIDGAAPETPLRVTAQIRYRHEAGAARVEALPGARARVLFDEPQRAITPGQAVVFYEGDFVIGGGWIESTLRR